jgi:hypothetical protein
MFQPRVGLEFKKLLGDGMDIRSLRSLMARSKPMLQSDPHRLQMYFSRWNLVQTWELTQLIRHRPFLGGIRPYKPLPAHIQTRQVA